MVKDEEKTRGGVGVLVYSRFRTCKNYILATVVLCEFDILHEC